MGNGVFLIKDDDQLIEMQELPYPSEDLLQKYLADHPSLIPGSQIDEADPRRWLLISREALFPSDENGPDRWSVDHLFLDQDAIPTLKIKQYAGQGWKTLVPIVHSLTEEARIRKGGNASSKRQWYEDSFFGELKARRGDEDAETARKIMEWARDKQPRFWWGKGQRDVSFFPIMVENEAAI